MQPKISIIIPVYGVEKYIEECLNSIINQTLKEIEIIIVNDGTKDKSMKIVEKYLHDSRIRVINKENGGISSARNAGILASTGKYIYTMDSDDFIEKFILKKVYDYAEKKQLEIVIFDIEVFCDRTKKNLKIWKDTNFLNDKVYQGIDYLKEYFLGKGCPSVANKIFRRELYFNNNIYYPINLKYGEDGVTMTKLMAISKKVGKISEIGYYYRQREESAMNSSVDIRQYLISYNMTIDFLKKHNLENKLKEYFDTYKFYYIYGNLFEKEYSKTLNGDYKIVYEEFFKEIKTMKIYNLKFNQKILVYSYKKSIIFGNLMLRVKKYIKKIINKK